MKSCVGGHTLPYPSAHGHAYVRCLGVCAAYTCSASVVVVLQKVTINLSGGSLHTPISLLPVLAKRVGMRQCTNSTQLLLAGSPGDWVPPCWQRNSLTCCCDTDVVSVHHNCGSIDIPAHFQPIQTPQTRATCCWVRHRVACCTFHVPCARAALAQLAVPVVILSRHQFCAHSHHHPYLWTACRAAIPRERG